MAKSRLRKNRGKGKGAQARREKVRAFNDRQRERMQRLEAFIARTTVESVFNRIGRDRGID